MSQYKPSREQVVAAKRKMLDEMIEYARGERAMSMKQKYAPKAPAGSATGPADEAGADAGGLDAESLATLEGLLGASGGEGGNGAQ